MAYLIPLIFIISSAAGILYIVARKAKSFSDLGEEGLIYPKFEEEAAPSASPKLQRDEQLQGESRPEFSGREKDSLGKKKVFEDTLFLFMEKFFRRTRIRLMKAENFFNNLAERLRERSKGDTKYKDKNFLKNNETSGVVFREENSEFDEKYWLGLIKHDPGSVYAYKKLGEIYIEREDFSQARSMLSYALKLVPDDSWTKDQLFKMKGKRTKK